MNYYSYLVSLSQDGMTLTMHAAIAGHMKILKLLVARGSLVNYSHPLTRQTALHYAAMANQRTVVEWLLEQGADPKSVNTSKIKEYLTIN